MEFITLKANTMNMPENTVDFILLDHPEIPQLPETEPVVPEKPFIPQQPEVVPEPGNPEVTPQHDPVPSIPPEIRPQRSFK